ncbi:IMPG2 protein, partial [Halcyon senegalensis]|nr:IMPG2 protein [Halcyon senegalensis]
LPGLAGGWGSDSRPRQGTGVAWQGPHSAPHPSLPSLGAGGHRVPVIRTAQPAVGTGPTSLPVGGKGLGLTVPTAIAGTPGVTSPGLGEALDLTGGVLGPLNTKAPPEHSPIPLDQTWHPSAVPGQPPTSVTPGSTAVAQSRVSYASPGSPHISPSRQTALISGSAAATSPAPQPFPGTSQGVPGLSPTTGTPPVGPSPGHQLPHVSSGGDPAENPQILGGIPTGVGDAGAWAATVPARGQPGSLAPSPAPGTPQQPAPSLPVSSLGPTTANSVTTTAVTGATTTITATTASLAQLKDAGTITSEPAAVLLQGNAAELTWGPPSVVPGPPQQLTKSPGTLGHGGGTGSPPAAGDTDMVPLSSSPGAWPDADTPQATPALAAAGRAPRVFIVEDQPPLWRAPLLRIPCQLVLDMRFVPALQDPGSPERRLLLHSFNRTVTPLFTSVPGFLRLEVTGIREGSVVLEYDALFAAERVRVPGLGTLLAAALGSGGSRPGLAVGTAPVLRNVALEWPLDPCALLFACRAGFACVSGADGNATCTSLCHRNYCRNHGICTHPPDRGPLCQCPVGSDFWFMGLRCDYRVTQQSLLGMAAGILLSIVLLGAAVTAIAIRRFKVLLLEARADQTRSSYRRFCRLDDISAQYWSRSWLPSASSLDNPAFSNSEELLHLQMLDNGCCSCREDSGIADSAKQCPVPPARPPRRPSFHYDWDTSSSSMNDPMVDSGKASDISVSSWPMEPLPWTPFPLLHQLSRQRPHKARRPRSYCEGMELVNLERSWTA